MRKVENIWYCNGSNNNSNNSNNNTCHHHHHHDYYYYYDDDDDVDDDDDDNYRYSYLYPLPTPTATPSPTPPTATATPTPTLTATATASVLPFLLIAPVALLASSYIVVFRCLFASVPVFATSRFCNVVVPSHFCSPVFRVCYFLYSYVIAFFVPLCFGSC